MQNYKPLHNNVIVKKLEAEKLTKGGVIIPDTILKEKAISKVVQLGSKAATTKINDLILCADWQETKINIDGEPPLFLVNEGNILAIVTEEKGKKYCYKPTQNKVVVKLKQLAPKTQGGVIIPDDTKEADESQGEIIEVSVNEANFSKGQQVFFDPADCFLLTINKEQCAIVFCSGITAITEND